jgi:hypothetical protein
MKDLKKAAEKSIPLVKRIEKTRIRRKSYTLDLRIHSPESLGYFDLDGIDPAPALVRLAKVKGIDVIGITDLYRADFVDRLSTAARETPLTVIPGVDLRTNVGNCDDMILSCFFPEECGSNHIEAFLSSLGVSKRHFGKQDLKLTQPFDQILAKIEEFDGIALPSRVDKTPHRLSAVPILVEEYGFRTFEVAFPEDAKRFFKAKWPKIKFQLFSFSNASALAQVGSRIAKVKMPIPGFAGVKELVSREIE